MTISLLFAAPFTLACPTQQHTNLCVFAFSLHPTSTGGGGGGGGSCGDETQLPLSENLSGAELRRWCGEANVPTYGTREQMVARIRGAGADCKMSELESDREDHDSAGDETQLPLSETLSGAELRRRCGEANVPTYGTREQVVARIRGAASTGGGGGGGGSCGDETQLPLSENLSGAELRRRCGEANVPTYGTREQMVAWIRGADADCKMPEPESDREDNDSDSSSDGSSVDLDSFTVLELKELCLHLELKRTGSKQDLIWQIVQHVEQQQKEVDEDDGDDTDDETNLPLSVHLSGAELRRRCEAHSLATYGAKGTMIKRIQGYLGRGSGGGGSSSSSGAVDEAHLPLSTNLSGTELRRRCAEANLSDYGTKEQKVSRIEA